MTWILIAGMALITFANRYAFLARSIGWQPSLKLQRWLEYSSYSVLTAIWVPIVAHANGPDQPIYFFGAVIAAVMTMFRLPSLAVVILSSGLFFLAFFLI